MKRFSKVFRWILRLDVIRIDSVVDEYLQRNREALARKQREWAESRSGQRLSGSSA